jgi:hypothetical protein
VGSWIDDTKESKNEPSVIRRRKLDKDWAAGNGRGSLAVTSEFQSGLIKQFNFLHSNSNGTSMPEVKTPGSMYL